MVVWVEGAALHFVNDLVNLLISIFLVLLAGGFPFNILSLDYLAGLFLLFLLEWLLVRLALVGLDEFLLFLFGFGLNLQLSLLFGVFLV